MDPKYNQPQYPPSGPPPTYPVYTQPTVTTTTTNIMTSVSVGPEPQHIICPSCHSSVRTIMRYENTSRTHCFALLLCLFICWPCVCLPYCMDSCRNGNHYCPNCHAYIGTYQS